MKKIDESGPSSSPNVKMRKHMSETEKIAVELSKMSFSVEPERKIRVENNKLVFLELWNRCKNEKCTWRENRSDPSYCKDADLVFQASLPDRAYLTRFSVRCSSCYVESVSGVHLYCEYCNEVLTGSIAGPGGKITDHLITIRHVYQQAGVLRHHLENGTLRADDLVKAKEYASRLDEWSDRVRYPVSNTIRRIHFEELLRRVNNHLGLPEPSVWVRLREPASCNMTHHLVNL